MYDEKVNKTIKIGYRDLKYTEARGGRTEGQYRAIMSSADGLCAQNSNSTKQDSIIKIQIKTELVTTRVQTGLQQWKPWYPREMINDMFAQKREEDIKGL